MQVNKSRYIRSVCIEQSYIKLYIAVLMEIYCGFYNGDI